MRPIRKTPYKAISIKEDDELEPNPFTQARAHRVAIGGGAKNEEKKKTTKKNPVRKQKKVEKRWWWWWWCNR